MISLKKLIQISVGFAVLCIFLFLSLEIYDRHLDGVVPFFIGQQVIIANCFLFDVTILAFLVMIYYFQLSKKKFKH